MSDQAIQEECKWTYEVDDLVFLLNMSCGNMFWLVGLKRQRENKDRRLADTVTQNIIQNIMATMKESHL